MDSQSLIEILRYERKKLDDTFTKVYEINPNAQITSEMNLNQLIGHISWYENQLVKIIQNKGEKPKDNELDDLPIDEKNRKIALLYGTSQFEQVKEESDKIFANLVLLLKNVTGKQLEDTRIMRNDSDDRLPWQALIENSFIHYEEHIASIKQWLKINKANTA